METTEITTHTLGDIELRGFTDENGDPLFVASDVAKALDYRNASDMTRLLDEWEVKGTQIVRTLGGEQSMTVITEAGVYHAIFVSSKKEAVEFRRWVCEDVLPSIRKHGYYAMESKLAQCHKEIERLLNDNSVERAKINKPVRLAEARAENSAHKEQIRELEADAAASRAHIAALRIDEAIVENEDLRKVKRLLQGELRQANEVIVFLQRRLGEVYSVVDS